METKTKKKQFGRFGDKNISITDLKRNKFMIFTIHDKRLGCYPTIVVSNVIRNMVLDYVLKEKWNVNEYNKLPPEDKKDMDHLLQLCGLEYDLGVDGMDDSSKDIKRFEVLKGELLAGNDSKNIIRELQVIVLRLSANRKIPKSRANELMYELVCLL